MSPRTQSDSEDDEDYVPQDLNSDSEDEHDPKRQRLLSPKPAPEETEDKKRERDALWTSFQASVASSSGQKQRETEEKKLVKVQKRYLFAGEYITEIVEVPQDSPDAKKWPLYLEIEFKLNSESSASPQIEAEPSAASTLSAKGSPAPSKPPLKKPGPRKPKTVLGALPSASSQKAKKLTTLDKSLMDWTAHTQDTTLQDELDANRKTGGYLEKVEFLQRVDERKEENLEAMKGKKRRKL